MVQVLYVGVSVKWFMCKIPITGDWLCVSISTAAEPVLCSGRVQTLS